MNHPQPSNPQRSGFAAAPAEDKSMPLGVSEFSEEPTLDPLANAAERRKINTGSLVIVVVILIACAGLWMMRSLGRVGAASSANGEVEATIDKFIKAFNDQTPRGASKGGPRRAITDSNALEVLSGSYIERQVPLTQVQRNPFIIPGEHLATSGQVAITDEMASRKRKERTETFERMGGQLQLKSIIMSSEPLANISGKIVRSGGEIACQDGVIFKVQTIAPEGVTIIGEDPALAVSVSITLQIKH